MNIIFDYNRTLFDPSTDKLFEGTYEILEKLAQEHKLFLLSYNEFGRKQFMRDTDIAKFFENISLVDHKNRTEMLALTSGSSPSTPTLVVGDNLRNEIAIGNELGYQTVWLKRGSFSFDTPGNSQAAPTHTISTLEEIFKVIEKYQK